jgi:hypothetical protein
VRATAIALTAALLGLVGLVFALMWMDGRRGKDLEKR